MNSNSEEERNSQGTNRLGKEKSPYLLQHAHNPVDWFPWGEEAFEKAREEEKPIFLSIGYSTCHWCHVMERESFEDDQVGNLLNKTFVPIKVDREERPDIDHIYMQYCLAVNGSGGWPLTIILTPEKKPFFAATYIPKESRGGRPGLVDLIPRIDHLWQNEREDIYKQSEEVGKALQNMTVGAPGKGLDKKVLDEAYEMLHNSYDPYKGGFSEAPKFPSPHNMLFLLRYWKREKKEKALDMVVKTLTEMRRGGIYDQIGFGFHRYSTDKNWLLPHFEKMLYDQAMLSLAYTEAYQITGQELFRQTAEEIFTYVARDMTHSQGGFYSAEDADSEGVEGKFYVWSKGEIEEVLDEDLAALIKEIYNVEEEGNFREEATGHKTGDNIFYLEKSWEELAEDRGEEVEELKAKVEKARKELFHHREERIHPHKDDKILTDWNGMMIAALSRAGRAFGEEKYIDMAREAFDFIEENLCREKRLLHRYRDGEAGIEGFLDDYAFVIWGLIELYEATFEVSYLQKAVQFQEVLFDHFWDNQGGSYYLTADDAEELVTRPRELYDGAIPAGNSIALWNLFRLSRMTSYGDWEEKTEIHLQSYAAKVRRYPAGYTGLLIAVDFDLAEGYEVIFVGEKDSREAEEMISPLNKRYLPHAVTLFVPDGESDSDLFELAEFAKKYEAREGEITVYVCRDYSCQVPTSDLERVLEFLGEE